MLLLRFSFTKSLMRFAKGILTANSFLCGMAKAVLNFSRLSP